MTSAKMPDRRARTGTDDFGDLLPRCVPSSRRADNKSCARRTSCGFGSAGPWGGTVSNTGRAASGARLLSQLAERLTLEYGTGFDERNLRRMRAFFQTFPIWNAPRTELSRTHHLTLLGPGTSATRHVAN